MNFYQFLELIIPELIDNNITVCLDRRSSIEEGTSGIFDSTERKYIVGVGSKVRYDIAIHEYCHYLQYKKDRKFWNKHSSGCNKFFTWLEDTTKKVYEQSTVERYLEHALMLELDCENRAVNMIRSMNLEVDIIQYIQNANAYLFSYALVREKRKWPKRSVYIPSIAKLMPEFLLPSIRHYGIGSLLPEMRKRMEKQFI